MIVLQRVAFPSHFSRKSLYSRFVRTNPTCSMSSSHESYTKLSEQMSVKHRHPAAERNKQPILEALQKYIDRNQTATLLEISSGSGQHVAHISPNFPNVTFQPTEYEPSSLQSIGQYVLQDCSRNVKAPQYLNVKDPPERWLGGSLEQSSVDFMLNINLIHISDWGCSEGLFKGASYYLKPLGLLFTYGPYAVNGVITPESNVRFDASLRSMNSAWGLRDIESELKPLAARNGLELTSTHDLPANNKFLVWTKTKEIGEL